MVIFGFMFGAAVIFFCGFGWGKKAAGIDEVHEAYKLALDREGMQFRRRREAEMKVNQLKGEQERRMCVECKRRCEVLNEEELGGDACK